MTYSKPDTRPRCPYCGCCKRGVCKRCRAVVRLLFPPDVLTEAVLEQPAQLDLDLAPKSNRLPARPVAEWLKRVADQRPLEDCARTIANRFATNPDSEWRQLVRIKNGHVATLSPWSVDRILTGLNGPTPEMLYGRDWAA